MFLTWCIIKPESFFLLSSDYCYAPTTCKDKGYCKMDGYCDCVTNYYGTDCSSRCFHIINNDWTEVLKCISSSLLSLEYCNALTTCQGKGDCKLTGHCDCDTYYYGSDCSSKCFCIFVWFNLILKCMSFLFYH